MMDFEAIKKNMEEKMFDAVYRSVADLTLALLQDDEMCRPIERMESRDAAKCELALDIIFRHVGTITDLMAKDVWRLMKATANLSVWPETKDEVSPVGAVARLDALYDAAHSIRIGDQDVRYVYTDMLRRLMDLEKLG